MLVPFVIDADGVAPDPAWTPAQQRACHKSLLDVWQGVGLLVHDGDSFIGSRLHQSVEKLPQNLRALWKEVLERVPLRSCGATWSGAVTATALPQVVEVARLALVDDACAEVEFGMAIDADGQCLQIDSERRVDIYRLLMANQAPAFKDAIARSGVHVEAGETFRAIWDARFEALAAAPLKRVAIVDRFAVSRHYEQDLTNGLSGLERFMRLLDTAANGPRHVTVFSAWTAELHGKTMADIEADARLLFGRLPVRQIKRIRVVMAPNSAFRVDGHDRFVRFEDYVWDVGTGIQILEGAFAASRSAASFKTGLAVAGYKRVENDIAGHGDAKTIVVA